MAKTYYDDDEEEFGGFGREAVEEAAKRPTYASTRGQVGERERMEAAVAGPLKKPAVVTKEQMKKAGFDNLRDYLNSQKGLKRRDSKPAVKFDQSKAAEVPKPSMDLTGKDTKSTKRPMKISEIGRKKMSMEDKMKAIRGMKKGGMVSSASKRADGIAKKGKTRGRMV